MNGNTTNNSIYLTPDLLSSITGGEWINYVQDIRFTGIGSHGILEDGNLSFAISCEEWRKKNLDIEYELLKIFKKGALAIVVDRKEYAKYFNRPILVVDDVNETIKKVGMTIRQQLNPKTILIAGSVGKTGFKTQLNHILSPIVNTHAMINSANVKLPILYSLISLKKDDKIEIVEVSGAARFEVGVERSTIVNPDIVVFTNVSPNHMRVHKTLDNFLKAKASAVVGMRKGGICLINKDTDNFNALVNVIKELRSDIKIVTFGEKNADAIILEKEFDNKKLVWHIKAQIKDEIIDYDISLFHSHAPQQTIGVLLAVKEMGYDICKAANNYLGLKAYETMGRLFEININNNKKIYYYDQSLRGAIDGMKSALKDIQNINPNGRVIAVIGGSSTELDSEFTKQQHTQLADAINDTSIDKLYTIGPFMNYVHDNLTQNSKKNHIMYSDDKDSILEDIIKDLQDEDFIFVMGNGYLKLGYIGSRILKFGTRKQIV